MRIIKHKIKWAGHAAGMGMKRNAYRIWVAKLEGKRLRRTHVGGRIILKWISEKGMQ
jgi:hypothetical protein